MKNSFIFERLLLKIVKLSLVQLVLILIFTGITTATPVKGQEMLDTKVTLSLSNVSLENALSELEKSAKVKFSYNSRTLKLGQKVNVTAKNEVLSSVLSKLLKPLNIKYIPISNRIVLRNDEEPKVGFSQEAEQTTKIDKLTSADIIIKGTVADENGEKLPGVSITVKGTTKGSISNTNGEYSIAVQDEKSVLVFNFVGYYVQEIMVGNQTKIDVLLKIDNKTLDEVLVVGYGSVKKSDLTGSVASLKQEEFNPGANSSIDQLMLGKAAGVQITQNSSEPGGGVSVRIRGVSSLNAGSDPLYVIDGLPIDNSTLLSSSSGGAGTGTNSNPRNPLNTINPNDIESIEILKDASATAIYGSRGANGVILITTKKGKNGKVNVGYDFNLGTQSVANKIDILDTQQYIKAMNDISKDEGRVSEFSNDAIAKIGAGVNWQDQVLQSAMLSSHNLSISGGDDKTTFFSSLNYYDQDGVVKNTGIKKYIARVNLNRKLGENIRMGICQVSQRCC